MAKFITFEDLQNGQPVKIAGKTMAERGFLAVEVVLEPAQTSPKLEGEVQAFDSATGNLCLFNRTLSLENGIEVKDSEDNIIGADGVQAGDVVKIKGKYVNGHSFMPIKIKKKQGLEFNIEEMQGVLNGHDLSTRSFEVNGVDVYVNEKTIFQAG